MPNNHHNHIEFEGKILEINTENVIKKLKKLGAKKILDAVTYIETYDLLYPDLLKKSARQYPYKFYLLLKQLRVLARNNKNLIDQRAYLRLRQEGKRRELVLKYPSQSDSQIKAEREISIEISQSEWRQTKKMLQALGFEQCFYQEKKRISYIYEKIDLRFDLDTWPRVPTYVEIEGKCKSDIITGAKLIGYKPKELLSIKAKELFKKYSVCPIYLSFKKAVR